MFFSDLPSVLPINLLLIFTITYATLTVLKLTCEMNHKKIKL